MRTITVAVAVTALLCVSSFAQAKPVDERVDQLEKKIEGLQNTYMNNNADTASAIAKAQSVGQEFDILKGQVEANRHIIESQRDDLTRSIESLDRRLQAVEDRLDIFASQLSQALSKVAPKEAAEGDQYQASLKLADDGKYLEAAAGFQSFLQKYPKSPFAANATKWIAECFYSLRDFQRAIKEYQTFIDKFPQDTLVADAVLKQGNSFFELGMANEAQAFYEKIVSKYPSSQAAAQAKSKLAQMKGQKPAGGAGAVSSGLGDYPAETIEQRNQRTTPIAQPQDPKQGAPKKPALPQKDF